MNVMKCNRVQPNRTNLEHHLIPITGTQTNTKFTGLAFMYLGVSLADDCEGRGPGNKVRLDEWNRRLAKLATSIENSEN